ncbi:malonyl-ACP O-methyltransferase BioC [Gilvimarinus sp. 1_MG-2023]|uniref:malonyl-ACP O-methyltransferase BioC n=1 Tax=Gilvimarinus sp. 1_MG-2023 TaxID=3062638 RepID=UPI0026E46793|nr:malonyl-ACP O-methyltransferase BioC [Gilvimarinus sp. 1_MG-2023]MDO6748231.1 malonyl-ACP O-methyltransferase BioC [Gilvimarinus sp. 1_MG-2023]
MIAPQIYPAYSTAGASPIVLLHGWGFSAASMAPLIEPLRQVRDVWCVDLPGFGDQPSLESFDVDSLMGFLAECLPVKACLVGWSLGGVLALTYAERFPARVDAVVSLAVNGKFVASADWPEAMERKVNRLFSHGFAAEPTATLKRFCGLVAQGSWDERARLRSLRALMQLPESGQLPSWRAGLELLSKSDLRLVLHNLNLPCLHILAEGDGLVPASAQQDLGGLNRLHRVECVADAGHAVHWDQSAYVAQLITAFLLPAGAGSQPSQLDKRWVAKSFSRAAASYDSAARLQRQVGERLLTRLGSSAGPVIDLGSGTGHFLTELRQLNPGAELLALDIAEGMLSHSRRCQRPADAWLCADAEALPFAAGSIDTFFSSLAIQWCEDLLQLFSELLRSLHPGGQLCLSTLTEGTLLELTRAWQAVDGYVHVNHFVTVDVLREALLGAGFVDINIQQEPVVLHCASLRELSTELKSLGAHNVNTGRPKGLTGRMRLAKLEAAYERERTVSGLPVTYQVCYIQAYKPQ